jgi:hypothetical protein
MCACHTLQGPADDTEHSPVTAVIRRRLNTPSDIAPWSATCMCMHAQSEVRLQVALHAQQRGVRRTQVQLQASSTTRGMALTTFTHTNLCRLKRTGHTHRERERERETWAAHMLGSAAVQLSSSGPPAASAARTGAW